MTPLLHFFQYHNAVPVALGILILGGTGVFAATNPEAIYSQQHEVLTVDNTYLVGKDLSSYSPRAVITAVTEDENDYFVEYEFHTIDVDEYVWKDVIKKVTMQVSKTDLGEYRDLGLYVTQQLRQVIEREASRLSKTQENARSAVTQLTVATSYGGLIGKFLDDSTETLPGYTPVVQPQVAAAAAVFGPADGSGNGSTSNEAGSTSASGLKIGLQLLGNNPARIPLGASYADLGAVLVDPYQTNAGVYMRINGVEKATWTGIDTSTTTAHSIEYSATDPGGAVITVRRIVLVGDAANPGGEVSEAGNVRPAAPPQVESENVNVESPAGEGGSTNEEASSDTISATSTPAQEEVQEEQGDEIGGMNEEASNESGGNEGGSTESGMGSTNTEAGSTEIEIPATTTEPVATESEQVQQATTTPEN